MDADQPEATAVAIRRDRVLAVGSLVNLQHLHNVDSQFANHVICAGLIDQHLHPVLGASTLMTEVIATEEWVLPDRTYPAATSAQEYRDRLTEAERRLPAAQWLFSWGYHKLWHGPLNRGILDSVSATRPIAIWQRSCAIISQLMQMRDPYLDDAGKPDLCHHGEWMMQPETFREFANAYWTAEWQLHIHVNGDAGLELVLDTIEKCMASHPRSDHRTVIVHFANSTEEQIDRIAQLGCIVSANSYYPVGFADKYAAHGLGPNRADTMVKAASVLQRGIPLSLHSDLPMGPAAPLTLAWCAVNRQTPSGRIAGPEQRISVHAALRAVTIEAAYSWRLERQLGSITPGKIANFTVLGEDPYAVDPRFLKDIPVIGTIFEGQCYPVRST